MRILATYLEIFDTEDEDFARREQRKILGSCEWLLKDSSFVRWRDRDVLDSSNYDRCQVYWLSGDPGCGKMFLATHVISHLRDRSCDSSFYFLKHGDRSKQNLGSLLKAIAYQMARRSASLRRSLLSMQKRTH